VCHDQECFTSFFGNNCLPGEKKKIAEEAFGEGGCHDDEDGSRRGEGGGDDLKMIEMIEIGS